MNTRTMNLARAACWIVVFSGMGIALMKFAFAVVCWIGGHDIFESMLGMIGSIGFGVAIGVESFLWFRDWRVERLRQ